MILVTECLRCYVCIRTHHGSSSIVLDVAGFPVYISYTVILTCPRRQRPPQQQFTVLVGA